MENLLEKEKNSVKYKEEGSPMMIDFRQIWMLFVLNWRWFVASIVVLMIIAYGYCFFRPNRIVVSNVMQIKSEGGGGGGSVGGAAEGFLNSLPISLGSSIGGSRDVETEIQVLTSRPLILDVVKELGLYTEYYTESWGRRFVQYKTQPLEITLDPAHLKWLDKELLTANRRIDLTIVKTSSGYEVEPLLIENKVEMECPKQTFKNLPITVKTAFGTVNIVANPLLSPKQAEAYHDGFTLKASIYPPMVKAQMFRGGLSVAPPTKKSVGLLLVSLQDDNLFRGIDFINCLIDCYNKKGNDEKNKEVLRNEEYVNERLAKLDIELGTSDANWESYKKSHLMVEPDEYSHQIVEKKNNYESQLINIGLKLQLHDYLCDYVNNPSNLYKIIPTVKEDYNLDAEAAGGKVETDANIERHNSLVIQRDNLLKGLSEQAPAIQRLSELIKELHPTIKMALERDRHAILIKRQAVEREYDKYLGRVSNAPRQERELTDIARQREIKQGVYLVMLQKREEIAMDLAKNMMKGQLIDEPILGSPNRPLSILLLGALLLGIVLPLAVLFLLQILKTKIDTKQELEKISKLPILSEVFLTDRGDAIRTLRTNLLLNLKNGQKTLVVTSHDKGDGKTYIAQHLVESLRQIDKKAQYLNLNFREDKTKADQAADLLAGADLAKQIESLKAENDYLILDTPAMGKFTDVYQIAQFADATVFVVKAEATKKSAVKDIAKDAFIPDPMLVLNAIDLSKKKYKFIYK